MENDILMKLVDYWYLVIPTVAVVGVWYVWFLGLRAVMENGNTVYNLLGVPLLMIYSLIAYFVTYIFSRYVMYNMLL